MTTREGLTGDIAVKKTEKKGFIHTAKAKIAATGLATALGLGGLGVLASQKAEDSRPSPAPTLAGDITIPNNSPESTIIPSPSPSETPTAKPTETPSLSPSEAPLPAWVKEIPPAKWTINEVPLNELTKSSGQLVEYPIPDSSDYVLSIQNATIVAVEPNPENNVVWVAMSVAGDKLTKEVKVVNINGEDKNYYKYKGLTVWYEFDNFTNVLKKNPAGAKSASTPIGAGLDYIAKELRVGDTFSGILSFINQGTKDQLELNKNTLDEINNSIGKQNIRENKTFRLYSQTVELNE